MMKCPECHGEGHVRTPKEKRNEALMAVLKFGAKWCERIAAMAIVLAIAPAVTGLFYGFAKFISWLTDAPMLEKGFGGNVGLTMSAGALVFVGVIAGLGLAGAAAVAIATDKEKS